MMGKLLRAIRRGDSKGVQALLLADITLNWYDENGCSPFFYAIHGRQFDIAEKLLERNADIDFPGPHGWAPLFWAAFNGHADIVAFLVAHGADSNASTDDGDSPLFLLSTRETRKSSGCFSLAARIGAQ